MNNFRFKADRFRLSCISTLGDFVTFARVEGGYNITWHLWGCTTIRFISFDALGRLFAAVAAADSDYTDPIEADGDDYVSCYKIVDDYFLAFSPSGSDCIAFRREDLVAAINRGMHVARPRPRPQVGDANLVYTHPAAPGLYYRWHLGERRFCVIQGLQNYWWSRDHRGEVIKSGLKRGFVKYCEFA